MTLTERAWELLVAGYPQIGVSDSFITAAEFEAESAKHEAPKEKPNSDREVFYAIAENNKKATGAVSDVGFSFISSARFDSERDAYEEFEPWPKDYFLVEVRRVK